MSDTTNTLQIPGAQLQSIEQGDNEITLHFSQVHLLQEMEGAIEDSLWTQAVKLTVSDIEIEGELPECPCVIKGGDLVDNIFTYRDHAPLPINWRGEVRCTLTVEDTNTTFSIDGESMQLEQIDSPRYIKHIKK
ncbi:MAG: hypothetical protein KAJ65_01420 [Gammaproteobacteria bacterium]|jgi:hypothetical protein|nr:hypothetical protein [Gammaproteobacteria bacterium]